MTVRQQQADTAKGVGSEACATVESRWSRSAGGQKTCEGTRTSRSKCCRVSTRVSA